MSVHSFGWALDLRVLLGVPLTLLLPLTVYTWRRLSRLMRIVAVLGTAGYLSIFVAIGTNKGVVDAAVVICVLVAALLITGRVRLTRRRLLTCSLAGIVLVAAVVAFFSAGQLTRAGGLARGLAVDTTAINWTNPARPPEESYSALRGRRAAYGPGPTAGTALVPIHDLVISDFRDPLLRPLPDKARRGILAFTGYLTEGYYGMSLALDQPWVPTFGLGSSYFIVRNASRVLGSSFEDRPYPMRVETHDGWDAYSRWTAFYAWVASDLSFPGVLLLLGLIGWILALAWLDTIEGSNPFAIGVFALLLLMIAYFPANNQVFANGETAVGAAGLIALWLATRQKRSPAYQAAMPATDLIPPLLRVAVVALVPVLGAIAFAWFRPVATAKYTARLTITPSEVSGTPLSKRARDGALLARFLTSPGVLADARDVVGPATSASAVRARVTSNGNVVLTATASTRSDANALAKESADHVTLLGRLKRERSGTSLLALSDFGRGAYSASPQKLSFTSGTDRFHGVLSVICGTAIGCGGGTEFSAPLNPGWPYTATVSVRSSSARPSALILAIGRGPTDLSTSPARLIPNRWTSLSVTWRPRTPAGSAAIAVQTTKPGATTFQVRSAVIARSGARNGDVFTPGNLLPLHSGVQYLGITQSHVARPLSSPVLWAAIGFAIGLLVVGIAGHPFSFDEVRRWRQSRA